MQGDLQRFETRLRDAGLRLDQFLAKVLHQRSRSFVQKLIDEGQVLVDGELRRRSFRLDPGSQIEVRIPPPTPTDVPAEDIPLRIVYQDADLLLVNKPVGMVVHPNDHDRGGTLVNALLHHVHDLSGIRGVEQPGIVHRIDKDTSGLLLVAKSDLAHRHLSEQFREHSIERCYAALVWGRPSPAEGVIESAIGRHPADRKKMSSKARLGKHAVTHYRVLEDYGACSLIECRLETGRTHQIRVHLSERHHPLLGDPIYGGTKKSWQPSEPELRSLLGDLHGQQLHAATLGFIHPISDEFRSFSVPPPDPMRSIIRALRVRGGMDPGAGGPWGDRLD